MAATPIGDGWEMEPEQLEEARRCLDLISRQWDEALGRLRAMVER